MANQKGGNAAASNDTELDAGVLEDLDAGSIELKEPELTPGKKIPDGFENPPPGEPGHKCVDLAGRYQPDWSSIMLVKTHEYEHDPQPVICAGEKYLVPRERWVDVPPEVMIGLDDAVEIRHHSNFDAGKILGQENPQPVEKTTSKRRRFVYERRPSA